MVTLDRWTPHRQGAASTLGELAGALRTPQKLRERCRVVGKGGSTSGAYHEAKPVILDRGALDARLERLRELSKRPGGSSATNSSPLNWKAIPPRGSTTDAKARPASPMERFPASYPNVSLIRLKPVRSIRAYLDWCLDATNVFL